MLEAILSRSGYRIGCYTSPHLLRYNERVRISQQEASDSELCNAFQAVEAARMSSGLSLTYFEFGTLAAMQLFQSKRGGCWRFWRWDWVDGWTRSIFSMPIVRF